MFVEYGRVCSAPCVRGTDPMEVHLQTQLLVIYKIDFAQNPQVLAQQQRQRPSHLIIQQPNERTMPDGNVNVESMAALSMDGGSMTASC